MSNYINNYNKIPLDLGALQIELIKWLKGFLALNQKEKGQHQTTPYVHIFVFLIVEQLVKHGDIHYFTGQGLEKLDQEAKHHYRLACVKKYDTQVTQGSMFQILNYFNRRDIGNLNIRAQEIKNKVERM